MTDKRLKEKREWITCIKKELSLAISSDKLLALRAEVMLITLYFQRCLRKLLSFFKKLFTFSEMSRDKKPGNHGECEDITEDAEAEEITGALCDAVGEDEHGRGDEQGGNNDGLRG